MKERIVRRTKEEIKKMRGKTDHKHVSNTSDKQIKEQVDRDPDSYIPTDEELEKFRLSKKGDKDE